MHAMDIETSLRAALQGFMLGGALIIAIGAQNAFVLRQGLRREHVGAVVLFCALADALLVAVGVFGAAQLQRGLPALAPVLTALGGAFLLVYGLLSLWRARRPGAPLLAAQTGPARRAAVLAQAAAFTLLNPHVYLDTVLLVGSVGSQQPSTSLQLAFVLGASGASLLWFSLLGLGSHRLAPWLAQPKVWQAIEALMGVLLLGLGLALLSRLS